MAISNNRADQEYLRLGTGIQSLHIPSLCLYTGVSYDTQRAEAAAANFDPSEHKFGNSRCLIEANKGVLGGLSAGLNEAIASCDFTSSDAALLQNKLRTWEDIFQRQAIIHFPCTRASACHSLIRHLVNQQNISPVYIPLFECCLVPHLTMVSLCRRNEHDEYLRAVLSRCQLKPSKHLNPQLYI